MKPSAQRPRNMILWIIAENDPRRLRERTVRSDKGKGRKSRPRNSNRARRSFGDD